MYKILIADDAKLMRDIICQVFREFGDFEIIIAHNGNEAVELYKQHQPDLVTMDITMEIKDGLQATQEIMTYDANAKIIIITSLGQDKLLNACLNCGAYDFIVKPFNKDRIKSAVQNVLGKKNVSIPNRNTSMLNSSMTYK
ncbi:response regulator [bacterium]|nr:response regulator [bacterium]